MPKCVAIVNYWDGGCILSYAVAQWHKLNIDVLIVYSNASNYGQITNNTAFLMKPEYNRCFVVKCEPLETLTPVDNERRKRNYGLSRAREAGYTHFITCDVDEFYEPFTIDWDLPGTVVRCKTYFKSPTLTIGIERTLVPFVHKLTPTIKYAFNKNYPFAFDKSGIRIDPSRQFNINDRVVMNENIVCHHYSYVRENIVRKIENSTARNNIRKAVVLDDMEHAKPGYHCRYYDKVLMEIPNLFGIPEF